MRYPIAIGRWAINWKVTAPLLLLLGTALRAGFAYPVHRFPADADCLMAGLRTFRILEGQFPVFLMPPRIGSLECYGHALAFRLFGISRGSLALTPLISGTLALILFAILCRWLLGRTLGLLALVLFMLPSPTYLFWTYMPNSYAETTLLCVCVLVLVVRIDDVGATWPLIGALGVVSGLAWWQSFLTLGCVVPALGWLAVRNSSARRPRWLALFAAAFLIGAFPWIIYNIHHPLASFHRNWATRPTTEITSAAANASHVVTNMVPEFLAPLGPEAGPEPFGIVRRSLRVFVLGIYLAALVFAVVSLSRALIRRTSHDGNRGHLRSLMLMLAVVAAVCSLPIFSGAGGLRGLRARYVLPLALAAPILVAYFLSAVSRRSRAIAISMLAAILALNCWAYPLPWSAARGHRAAEARADGQLVEFLRGEKVDAVCADYWLAYPITFLTKETIIGVPLDPNTDHYKYGRGLPLRPLHWALVSRTEDDLRGWVARTKLPGTMANPALGYYVFLPGNDPLFTHGSSEILAFFRLRFYYGRPT